MRKCVPRPHKWKDHNLDEISSNLEQQGYKKSMGKLVKGKIGELWTGHERLCSRVITCSYLNEAVLVHACCPRLILVASPFTLKRWYILWLVIHCMIGPLIANAKESGLLVRGRRIVLEEFQQESEWSIIYMVGRLHSLSAGSSSWLSTGASTHGLLCQVSICYLSAPNLPFSALLWDTATETCK